MGKYGISTLQPFFHLRADAAGLFCDYGTGDAKITNNIDTGFGEGIASKFAPFFSGHAGRFFKIDLSESLRIPYSFGFFVKCFSYAPSNYPIVMSFGLPYIAFQSAYLRLSHRSAASAQVNLTLPTLPLNEWVYVGVSFADGINLYTFKGDGLGDNRQKASTTDFNKMDLPTTFYLGTHAGVDQYITWGLVDDVRIYKNADVSEEDFYEIYKKATVSNYFESFPVLSLKDNGDVEVSGLEDDIEWTLLDSFLSDLDEGNPRWTQALGSTNINSLADLSAAGWSYNYASRENTAYSRFRGLLQLYLSGSTTTGYMQKMLPDGYDYVRIRWADFHTTAAATSGITIKLNGVTQRVIYNTQGVDEVTIPYTGTPVLRIEELASIIWIGDVLVGKSRNPSVKLKQSKWQSLYFLHTRYSKNLHPYDSWTVGSGSVGEFAMNGVTSENVRVQASDPWGRPTILWKSVPDGGNNADGGWNHSTVPIDKTKRYRYSVWVRRRTAIGRFYHGCNGYGTTDGVYALSTGTLSTNPYFWYGDTMVVDRWYLVVGHIHPYTMATGSAKHPDSGIYSKAEKFAELLEEFKWHSTSNLGRGRTYLFYSTSTDQIQEMCYPRFELCDGTEHTLGELLSGKAYGPFGKSEDTGLVTFPSGKTHRFIDGKIAYPGRLLIK